MATHPPLPPQSEPLNEYFQRNLIPLFFAVLGISSLSWMIGFNVFISKASLTRFFRSLGVSMPRTQRALAELKRKSFHLAGLLIPFIYYLGLTYSKGLMTRTLGLWLLGSITLFLWIVEILRYVSPSFRGHYNRLFSSIMRKQELIADAARLDTQEGTFAHSVDQLVQTITTPLLGELPPTPKMSQQSHHQHHTAPHLRSTAAASPSNFATPAEYHKLAKVGSASVNNTGAVPSSAPSHTAITSEKIFTGTGFFFLGNFLSMLLFDPTIATCAMLFLVLGDMTAAIVGISFGSVKIGSKSLEGTVAMFCVCFMVGSVFFLTVPNSSYVVFIAALAATLVELLGPEKWWADDNITIPIAAGVAFTAAFTAINGTIPHTTIPVEAIH